jgi:ABC-type bacteriocin/lantibiotic exporter with double-glycine peptidase domain
MAYAAQMQQQLQQQSAASELPGANVLARGVAFHPPGAEAPLLDGVGFDLRSNQLGLIIGRSGSGKTTLLQLLAGLTEQTAGDVFISRGPLDAAAPPRALPPPTHIEERMQQVCVCMCVCVCISK